MSVRYAPLDRRTFTLRAMALLSVGILAIPAAGCGFITPPVEETRTSNLAHVAGSPLSIETGNGAISVTTSPESKDVVVTARVRALTKERLAATKVLAERGTDNALKIYIQWAEGDRQSSEGCSFEVTLPDVRGVDLHTSNGKIILKGAAGHAALKTSNGAVTVERHDGDVKIKTSNGAVTGDGIAGAVDAESSNGAITVRLAPSSPGPVELESSNGAITLVVGHAFTGQLSVKTSNGSVTVPDGPGIVVRDRSKKSASVVFGEGSTPSKVKTSNGSVTVSRAD